MTEKKCCCNKVDLNKGIMFIGILTLVEFCIAFSNWDKAWFLLILKLILLILFIVSFKYFENIGVRRTLWVAYAISGVLEVIAIVYWAGARVNSSYAYETCD